ncbi:MAG: hypothetical protein R3A13_07460 [Bdellovibrionota bacterium]
MWPVLWVTTSTTGQCQHQSFSEGTYAGLSIDSEDQEEDIAVPRIETEPEVEITAKAYQGYCTAG